MTLLPLIPVIGLITMTLIVLVDQIDRQRASKRKSELTWGVRL